MKRKEVSAVAADAPAVKVVGLRKKYPRAAEYAVGGISFEVQRGEIVGHHSQMSHRDAAL